MAESPETYAFLLEYRYEHVRHWVLTGEVEKPIESLLPLLEDNQELIVAWVHHNKRRKNMIATASKDEPVKPEIGLVDFWKQLSSD